MVISWVRTVKHWIDLTLKRYHVECAECNQETEAIAQMAINQKKKKTQRNTCKRRNMRTEEFAGKSFEWQRKLYGKEQLSSWRRKNEIDNWNGHAKWTVMCVIQWPLEFMLRFRTKPHNTKKRKNNVDGENSKYAKSHTVNIIFKNELTVWFSCFSICICISRSFCLVEITIHV